MYCASLFDEVTELEGSLFSKEGKLILYPHQLFVVEEGGIEVKVKKSYYTGRDFLIVASLSDNPILFRSENILEENRKVFLDLKE